MDFSLSKKDAEYPNSLKEIKDPPQTLWGMGHAELLLEEKLIGIVGARECTSYGEKVAFDLAKALVEHDMTIVSGMAAGIDAAAHRGALEGYGKTIGVLGCGIDIVYPKRNEALYQSVSAHGLLLSEYPPGTQATPYTFPQRNRIISGLSKGIVVIEARRKSGALITAEWALQQGKEVFAVPGNVTSPLSEGTNRLIQQGAKLVSAVEDILEELKYPILAKRVDKEVEDRTSSLLDLLSNGPRHMDELVDRLGIPVEKISSLLMQLELAGEVSSLPGGLFQRHGESGE